jgi:hypothetical protein
MRRYKITLNFDYAHLYGKFKMLKMHEGATDFVVWWFDFMGILQ